MARQLNSFALLGDDEGEDVSVLLARAEAAAAAKVEAPFPADKKLTKNDKAPADNGRKSERGRGRGGSRGRGMRRSAAGGNEVEQYGSGGSDFYQAGTDISQREYAGNNGYHRSNGGDSSWKVTDDNSQGWGNGRGRGQSRGGSRGRGADRRRGYRESQGFRNEKLEPENENQGHVSNIIAETAGQDDGEDGGWQQVSLSRGKSDRYTKNNDRNWGGSERRGYSGGNRGYRAREGRSYGDHDGSNNENVGNGTNYENSAAYGGTNCENSGWNETNYEDGNFNGRNYEHHGVSQDSEPKDQINGDIVLNNGDENVAVDTEWNDPVPIETLKEPEIEQGKLGDVVKEDDAEKKKEEEEENQMTLEEYEKLRLEKRKTLESFKTKERKVTLDKDFESMQLIEKNREESLFIKPKSDKDKLKKKDSFDKEEKIRKVVSINEFLKPAEGGGDYNRRGGRGRGRGGGGGRGRGPGGFRGGREGNSTPHIEDPCQFPVLQAIVKA